MRLKELAEILKTKIFGNGEHEINKISPPESADEKSICVIWDIKELEKINSETAIIAPLEFFIKERDGLICDSPRAIMSEVIKIFSDKEIKMPPEISPYALIYPGAYIGENCEVGSGTVIEPNCVLLKNVKVGKNCIIHSGAVIGSDGFGFERVKDAIIKIPQI